MDDYERPVLEKYEKITPTPTVREKKEKEVAKVTFQFQFNCAITISQINK